MKSFWVELKGGERVERQKTNRQNAGERPEGSGERLPRPAFPRSRLPACSAAFDSPLASQAWPLLPCTQCQPRWAPGLRSEEGRKAPGRPSGPLVQRVSLWIPRGERGLRGDAGRTGPQSGHEALHLPAQPAWDLGCPWRAGAEQPGQRLACPPSLFHFLTEKRSICYASKNLAEWDTPHSHGCEAVAACRSLKALASLL